LIKIFQLQEQRPPYFLRGLCSWTPLETQPPDLSLLANRKSGTD